MASLKDLLPPPREGNLVTPDSAPPSTAAPTVVPAAPSPQAGVSKVITLPHKSDAPTVGNPASEPDFNYSAVILQGENASRTVHTDATALVEKTRSQALRPLPSQEDADAATARTRLALQQVIDGKTATTKSSLADKVTSTAKPSFVRYTPANANTQGEQNRIIKMVQAPVDPMLPPRFSHKKAPVNPPSPPVPVMHSPERKLSKEEAANWHIPPVVSNWKNNRGYTISLEKRLAADGRDSIDHSINDRFAQMAEALYNAERSARDDVEKRAQIQRNVALRAKEAKEKELRQLAERARRERKRYLGLSETTDGESIAPQPELSRAQSTSQYPDPPAMGARLVQDDAPPLPDQGAAKRAEGSQRRPRRSRFGDVPNADSGRVTRGGRWDMRAPPPDKVGVGGSADVRRRDRIREERRIEREHEMRQNRTVYDETTGPTLKRSKMSRDADRDLAEAVALGQNGRAGSGSGEMLYDQRLFIQNGRADGSLAGGYGADDAYNLYDRPLFTGGNATEHQYRPQRGNDNDKDGGADKSSRLGRLSGTGASGGARPRDRPVEFTKDTELKSSANDDPYGLDKFLSEAKEHAKAE
eukprot:GFKZ01011494.1.p1 GENE.GFKZ01011494.1~~GFKZ01011494.1.p1  ORF type:complete len:587 (+),score=84.17 GFKZ01011494.1:197-1957(+)